MTQPTITEPTGPTKEAAGQAVRDFIEALGLNVADTAEVLIRPNGIDVTTWATDDDGHRFTVRSTHQPSLPGQAAQYVVTIPWERRPRG